MTTRDRGSRATSRAKIACSPEQIVADTRLALIWRAQLRAEKASHSTVPVDVATPAKAGRTERQRRTDFAKGIARLELGRAYWDEKLHQGVAKKNGPVRPAPKPSARKKER
jgi:hypothetical protein